MHRMLKHLFDAVCGQVCGAIRTTLAPSEIAWLLTPNSHIALLAMRRATIIVTRVRLFAGVFAVLTPLWIILDLLAFPIEVWRGLVPARLVATLAFYAVYLRCKRVHGHTGAYKPVGLLMAVPAAFFFITYGYMAQFRLDGIQQAFAQGYAFLPFVMVAGLSIFPLTMAESIAFAIPTIIIEFVAAAVLWPNVGWPIVAATLWLMLLITAVSMVSGLSQLAFMIVLMRDAVRDRMTGCFTRASGQELLELQFVLVRRTNAPLAVAFIDIDHFKQINDRFGHEAGDRVLASVTEKMRGYLRTGDILIRWGGEEFLLVMPGAGLDQACRALARVWKGGFGSRPDGTPVTVSVGIAERLEDESEDWKALVEKADARMYEAKRLGRNGIVGCR